MALEIRDVPTRLFMTKYKRYEPLVLDSSAITTYKHCPRMYFFNYVLAFVPQDTEPYFGFGGAYHKFREVLETSKNFVTALGEAQNYYRQALPKGVELGSKWEFMTEDRLIKSCAVAFKHWAAEKQRGIIEVIDVERAFCVEIVPGSGEFTGGRFDQLIRVNGRVYGRDFKTTSKDAFYERTLVPNDQFTRYTFAEAALAGEQCHGQYVEVLFNNKTKGPKIIEHLASRTTWEIEDWRADEIFWRRQIQFSREEDRWPKNEKACAFCRYHSVCRMNTEKSQMYKLESEFIQRPWDHSDPDGKNTVEGK